jgi:hypothetical protein
MTQDGTGLSFTECGIANALTQYSLIVPLNQRSYAWSDNEVETFFTDLTKSFDKSESIYFLGMIVLTRGHKSGLEVADGQQRLATTSILIAAIRDYLLELNDDKAAIGYQSDYLLKYNPRTHEYQPKLHLNHEDNDFFFKNILKPPTDRGDYQGLKFASHNLLTDAFKIAQKHIRNMTVNYYQAGEKLTRLYDWMDFLHNNAKVIVIQVPGYVGNAYKMFETLNARGLRASQIDILKNHLYDKGKDRISDIHPHWLSMVSTIESLGQDDLLINFIRHYWIAHHGSTTERELGDKIENTIRGERQAVDLVGALDSFAIDYVALLTPREHPRWNDFSKNAKDCIYTVTRELGIKQILPLMLAIGRYFSVQEAEKAFRLCLSWSVRFLISGGAGGGLLDRHYGLRAKEISKREITTVDELAKKMVNIIPNDETFRASFEVATVRLMHLARYYLRAIDYYQKGEKFPQFVPSEDTQAVNAEHVLPITPDATWKIPPDIAASYYKRLGNICLMGTQDNVKIGNINYKDKKTIFKNSLFIATKSIADYTEWGPIQIAQRQKQLADLAPKIWPI